MSPPKVITTANYQVIKASIDQAPFPEMQLGEEIMFETKRQVAMRIRKLFKDLGIQGVEVVCPIHRKEIVIKVPKEINNHGWTLRNFNLTPMDQRIGQARLYEQLDNIVMMAYPYLHSAGYALSFGN